MDNVRHFGIVVSDLDRSLDFYQNLLGLEVTKKALEGGEYIDKLCTLKNASVTTVKMAARDGMLIELLYFHSHREKITRVPRIYDIGPSHIAFTVSDLSREYRRLSKAGVRFNSRPQISPDGQAKVAFCVDPDGVFIELVEPLRK